MRNIKRPFFVVHLDVVELIALIIQIAWIGFILFVIAYLFGFDLHQFEELRGVLYEFWKDK